MANGIGIEIAGVRISVCCTDAALSPEPDRAYDAFLMGQPPAPETADMTIFLETEDMPNVGGMHMLFDSDQSWSLFLDNEDYVVSLNPPATGGSPAWIARFDRDLTKATVYCEQGLHVRGENGNTIANPVRYPLDQILLMYLLSRKQGAIMHAAGVRIDEKCFIFPGRSGAGKSTVSRRLLGMRRSRELISDDRVIVRKSDDGYAAFGTPWPGEGGFALNKGFPLSGIFFLSQSDTNIMEKIGQQKAFELLLPVVSIPWFDREVMERVLQFCEDLVSDIPSYLLHFTPDEGVVKVLDEFVPE